MIINDCFKVRSLILPVVFFAALGSEAVASVTLQPVAASTNMGEYFREQDGLVFSTSHVIDQSVLYPHYTSNVSDFGSYLASHPVGHHAFGEAIWSSFEGVRSGNFDLNLGGNYIVNAMALWNLRSDPSAIRQFNILLDDNASFSNPIKFTGFSARNDIGPIASPGIAVEESFAQVFIFDPTAAHFVRLEILNTWGPSSFGAAFMEVMFGVSPIPEPETYALMLAGLGLVGLVALRKKAEKPGLKGI